MRSFGWFSLGVLAVVGGFVLMVYVGIRLAQPAAPHLRSVPMPPEEAS